MAKKRLLRNLFIQLFKLSDQIINGTSGLLFCYLFNLRALFIGSGVTIRLSEGFYCATDIKDRELKRYFKAEKQGNMAYGKGMAARIRDLKVSYFFDLIDFNEGDTIIDCGANVGDVELIFKSGVPIKYIGFEPSPNEYLCLSKNIGNHVVHNVGLWSEEGELDFFVASQGADSSIIEPTKFEKKITVLTAPLKNYITEPVKCLKLEAEGAEPEILLGLGEGLQKIEYITADVGFERGLAQESTLAEVSNILISNNFEMIAVGKRRLCVLFRNKSHIAR